MILFEKNNVELEYHPELNVLEVRWIGVLAAPVVTQMIEKIIEAANAYAIENILLDATQVDTGSKPALFDSRVQQYFLQQLATPSVKKIARIVSGQADYDRDITPLYLDLVQKNFSSLAFENFTHHYEAMHWLTGQR